MCAGSCSHAKARTIKFSLWFIKWLPLRAIFINSIGSPPWNIVERSDGSLTCIQSRNFWINEFGLVPSSLASILIAILLHRGCNSGASLFSNLLRRSLRILNACSSLRWEVLLIGEGALRQAGQIGNASSHLKGSTIQLHPSKSSKSWVSQWRSFASWWANRW